MLRFLTFVFVICMLFIGLLIMFPLHNQSRNTNEPVDLVPYDGKIQVIFKFDNIKINGEMRLNEDEKILPIQNGEVIPAQTYLFPGSYVLKIMTQGHVFGSAEVTITGPSTISCNMKQHTFSCNIVAH